MHGNGDVLVAPPPHVGGEYTHEPTPMERLESIEKYIATNPSVQGWFSGELVERDGVYLSCGTEGSLGVDIKEYGITVTDFEFIPGLQLGAGDSHHGVLFASASLKDGLGQSQEHDVAIKSFSATSGAAEHEHNAMVEVARRGFITFSPIAVARNGEDTYLVTLAMPNIETLDSVDWTIPTTDPAYAEKVVPELRHVARYLAKMNGGGVFHGDAQPKNIARNDEGADVLLDFENTTFANNEEELVQRLTGGWDIRDSKALEDLKHCWYTLTHPTSPESMNILFQGEDFDVCMEQFQTNFLEPYLDALTESLPETIRDKFNRNEFAEVAYAKIAAIT